MMIYVVLVVSILLDIAFVIYTKKRRSDIAKLSGRLNKILHGDNSFNLSEMKEGELYVLSSEIYKMTVMLREKSESLEADKVFLTDAITDIAHQLKTPLTSVNLLLSVLAGDNGERKMEILGEINSLLTRTDWLLTVLLKMSRIDAGVAEFRADKVYVADLIKKSAEPFLVLLDIKDIALAVDCTDSISYTGDFLWSVEAVSNIIKNCIEHTANSGNITITAKENELFTEIIIADNGSGISKDDLPHIFERFYKGKTNGYGIGLALAKMLITRQNGTITAENNTDDGAKFTIKFYHKVTI